MDITLNRVPVKKKTMGRTVLIMMLDKGTFI